MGCETQVELVMAALATVLDRSKANYFAVPISSGRRLWQLAAEVKVRNPDLVAHRYPQVFKKQVLEPNLKEAAALLRRVKSKVSGPLINPVEFFSKGWVQEDYRELWRRVLERWVNQVILAPGWEYSRGCVEECVTAYLRELRVVSVTEDIGRERSVCLRRLSTAGARGRVVEAAHESALRGLEVQFLDRAYRRLSKLC